MVKQPKFNILNNPFLYIGRPLFKVVLSLVTLIGFLAIFIQTFISKIKSSIRKFANSSISIFLKIKFSISKIRLPFINASKKKFPKIIFDKPPLSFSKYPKTVIRLKLRFVLFILTFGFLSGLIYYEFYYSLPNPLLLRNYPSKLTTQILDRNGKLLYKIYKEENRTLIKIDDLPLVAKQAFLAAEDKNFYQHFGFSVNGIIRAFYRNFTDDKLEGGSTITQQLVKNTLLTSEKTIDRKIKELVLALKVEHIFSKNEIFEMYLNQVGFGGPAYGIQEASRQYFNVDAKDLTLAQAAFLAGLPQAPSKYSPFGDHPELAKSRQKQVLQQMYSNGYITEDQLASALNTNLVFNTAKIEINAPHFVMFIRDMLTEQLGENLLNHGGLIVTTTLDLSLQEKAQKAVTDEIKGLKNYHVSNGAALITNPSTGEILSMVGSKDYFNLNEDGQVNLTTALRQPGSSIKPLNYALSFENGLNPGSIIEDKPISFNIVGQGSWTPKNYDSKFHGIVTLRQALANSYNIPSVILLSKNGINNFANFVRKMGIPTWSDSSRYGLSMALGSLEVRMVDLATAYSAFANKGKSTPLKAILSIQKNDGKNIFMASCPDWQKMVAENATANAEEQSCSSRQVISETTAYLISDILSDNNARSAAFGLNSVLNIKNAKVSVKTGTSNDLKDNWTIGYTPNYLVATWVGNNNNQPMANIASGITGASPIWATIMKQILENNPNQAQINLPENLTKVPICTLTGTLTCEGCPTKYELFEKGKEPKTKCNPEQIQKLLQPSPSLEPTKTPQIL